MLPQDYSGILSGPPNTNGQQTDDNTSQFYSVQDGSNFMRPI